MQKPDKDHERPLPDVVGVPLKDLKTDPRNFSPRLIALDDTHVAKLASVLKDGRQLDPIAVWQRGQGGALVVLDGHHRLAAYARVKWHGPVAVRVFKGTRAMALRVAAQENSKLRLPLSNAEKLNWAWRIVIEAGEAKERPEAMRDDDQAAMAKLSRQDVAAMAGVATSTVSNMRKVFRLFAEQDDLATGYVGLSGDWRRDQQAMNGNDMTTWTEDQIEEWQRQNVAELVDRLGPLLKRHVNHRPDVIAEALAEVLGRKGKDVAEKLAEMTGYSDDDDREEWNAGEV